MKGVWLMFYLRSFQLRLFRDLDALLNLKQSVCLSLLKARHSRPQFIYRADKLCPFPKLKKYNDKSAIMFTFTIIWKVTLIIYAGKKKYYYKAAQVRNACNTIFNGDLSALMVFFIDDFFKPTPFSQVATTDHTSPW